MLTTRHLRDPVSGRAAQNHELLEVHRSKISLHHAKQGYDYPTLRLPHTFSMLAGLSTRICQTVHDGALAFLVVVSPSCKGVERNAKKSENARLSAKLARLDMAEVAGSNPAIKKPIRLRCHSALIVSCTFFSALYALSSSRFSHTPKAKASSGHHKIPIRQ